MRKGALAVASGVLTSSSAVAQRPLPTIAKIFAAAFPRGVVLVNAAIKCVHPQKKVKANHCNTLLLRLR